MHAKGHVLHKKYKKDDPEVSQVLLPRPCMLIGHGHGRLSASYLVARQDLSCEAGFLMSLCCQSSRPSSQMQLNHLPISQSCPSVFVCFDKKPSITLHVHRDIFHAKQRSVESCIHVYTASSGNRLLTRCPHKSPPYRLYPGIQSFESTHMTRRSKMEKNAKRLATSATVSDFLMHLLALSSSPAGHGSKGFTASYSLRCTAGIHRSTRLTDKGSPESRCAAQLRN